MRNKLCKFTDRQWAWIEKESKRLEINMSEVIRLTIHNAMESEKAKIARQKRRQK